MRSLPSGGGGYPEVEEKRFLGLRKGIWDPRSCTPSSREKKEKGKKDGFADRLVVFWFKLRERCGTKRYPESGMAGFGLSHGLALRMGRRFPEESHISNMECGVALTVTNN
ncbi:hypothetical protein ACJRO7_006690 [Eucalyptus globulus]|uniref:Uncharacterized protein n=1 Tax=Eucalyptus globulus TaxID=34317 RepID=A0ABD3IMR5_EUCGL